MQFEALDRSIAGLMRRRGAPTMICVTALCWFAVSGPSIQAKRPAPPSSVEWLAIDGAVVVPCPRALSPAAGGRASCARVEIDPFEFRKLVRKRLKRSGRDGLIARTSWIEEDGFERLGIFVNTRWFDVMISSDGTLAALVRAPSCLGPEADALPSADELDTEPERVVFSRPDYPEAARVVRGEGSVVIHAVLGADGRIRRSCLAAEIPEGLDFGRSALAAVRHWRYEPVLREGTPVDVTMAITVDFELKF